MQEVTQETLIIHPSQQNMRLDMLLYHFYKSGSRTYFQNLIQDGLVLVNGKKAKKSYKPEVDDEIEVQFVANKELELTPENIPLEILYEDEWILAVNKKAGMVVHPAFGNWTGTFVNALLYHCRSLEKTDDIRPGIVHRLDKDTSGVLLAAKSVDVLRKLSDLFFDRKIEKTYLAVCIGKPANQEIHAPMGRHPIHRKQMAVLQEGGKDATTSLHCMHSGKNVSLVKLKPKTGRTHQLRVHLKHIGHPILGDSLYGIDAYNQEYAAQRQLLHAYTLSFIHPVLNTPLEIKAPVHQDMKHIIDTHICARSFNE